MNKLTIKNKAGYALIVASLTSFYSYIFICLPNDTAGSLAKALAGLSLGIFSMLCFVALIIHLIKDGK